MANMRLAHIIVASVFTVFLSTSGSTTQHVDDPESFLQDLHRIISEKQVKEDIPLIPGVQWARRKGDYDTLARVNSVGEGWKAYLRRNFQLPDNNLLMANYISSVMLEAFLVGGPAPKEDDLLATVNYIGKSVGTVELYPSQSTLLPVWPLDYNESTGKYAQNPQNWNYLVQMARQVPLEPIAAFLQQVGLGEIVDTFSYYVEDLKKEEYFYSKTPADIDDTSVWLSFGSLLYGVRDTYPAAWKAWKKWNPNVTSIFDAVKKYAYRPFSGDSRKDTVDPWNYYNIRHFLDEAKSENKDVALPSLYFIETGQHFINKAGISTNYLVAEADPTICANFMYGTTLSILTGMVSPDVLDKDSDFSQIYLNTSSLLAHATSGMTKDYYQHTTVFYWFVSRTVAALEAYRATQDLPVPEMETVYQELKCALQGLATVYLLGQVQSDEDGIFFDDFLGGADLTYDNKPLNRAEDRIFITATAANILMSTWLTPDVSTESTRTMKWRPGTPENVKHAVDGSITWLRRHTLDGQYEPWNMFFTAFSRGPDTEAILFPANRYEYPDGTPIKDLSTLKPTEIFMLGVKGYIPKDKYEVMMKQNDFGYTAPTSIPGFNNKNAAFVFYSTDALTYANVLLATAKYRTIQN